MKSSKLIYMFLTVILITVGSGLKAQMGDEDGGGDWGDGGDDWGWTDDNYDDWSDDGDGYGGGWDSIDDILAEIAENGLANFDDGYTHIEFGDDGSIESYNNYSWEEIDNDPSLVPDYIWDFVDQIQDDVDAANQAYELAYNDYINMGNEPDQVQQYMTQYFSQYGYSFVVYGEMVAVFDLDNPTPFGTPNFFIHMGDELPFPDIPLTISGGTETPPDPFADVNMPEPDYPPMPDEPFDPYDPDWQQWMDDYNNNTNTNPNPPTCATKVEFKEDASKTYGFDDKTVPTIPWKSVEVNKSDLLKVSITDPANYSSVYFKVVTPANLTINPATKAPSAAFNFTIKSANFTETKKETEVQANCNGVDGTNISKIKVVAYHLVEKTVAVRLVHSKADATLGYLGYTSTDVPDAVIIDYLNKQSYNQGLIKWTVRRLPAMTVDFDKNHDGKIDDMDLTVWSEEQQAVINACAVGGYNVNLFLVDHPQYVGGLGFSKAPGLYSFVYAGGNPNPKNSIAHELGHSCFGFGHEWGGDSENIMYVPFNNSRTKFRKDQWDRMHP